MGSFLMELPIFLLIRERYEPIKNKYTKKVFYIQF